MDAHADARRPADQTPLLLVTPAPLSLERLVAAVEAIGRQDGEGCGAVCSFAGIVRATHRGRRVTHLEYEAFDRLAIKVFDRVVGEIRERWPRAVVGIHHRVGRLA